MTLKSRRRMKSMRKIMKIIRVMIMTIMQRVNIMKSI